MSRCKNFTINTTVFTTKFYFGLMTIRINDCAMFTVYFNSIICFKLVEFCFELGYKCRWIVKLIICGKHDKYKKLLILLLVPGGTVSWQAWVIVDD